MMMIQKGNKYILTTQIGNICKWTPVLSEAVNSVKVSGRRN
jgi:hypothetical protein